MTNTKKVDKKKLEELTKILKEVKKEPPKKPQEKKEEVDEEEFEEDEEFFIEPETGFIRQSRHSTLNSGLIRVDPVATNLEESLEDVSVSTNKGDEELYSKAKYGKSYESEKYGVQNDPDHLTTPVFERAVGGRISSNENEFVSNLSPITADTQSARNQEMYVLPEKRFNQDEAQFGKTENEHVRKYKNL